MSNEFKGTPGPWILDESRHVGSINRLEPFRHIGMVSGYCVASEDMMENHANALLIAAAPKLFKAVNDFLNHFEGNIPLWLFEEAEGAVAEALGK